MLIKEFYFIHNESELIIDDNYNVIYNGHKLNIDKNRVNDMLMNIIYVINKWDNEYIDTSIIDGINWKICITYIEGIKKEYHGHGSYPDNFDAIKHYIKEIVGESK